MIDLEDLKAEPAEGFWNHLEELRNRAIFSIAALTILSLVSYFFSNEILSFLIRPISSASHKVYFSSPSDAFVVKLQVSFWSGIFLASPLLLTETWLFIAPALYTKEKRFFLLFLLASIALFLFGSAIAVLLIIPTAIQFFLSFSTPDLLPLISVSHYLSFYVWMALAFGLSFEAPIFLVGLVRFGVIGLQQLVAARRYIILGIFIFSAVITPSPDPFSQCALAVPLWLLFEVSVIVARFFRPRRR